MQIPDGAIGCASIMVRHKIKNISTNNEAMLLKLGGDVTPYEIYQMLHILMLLWRHARFQSPAFDIHHESVERSLQAPFHVFSPLFKLTDLVVREGEEEFKDSVD